MSDRFTSTQAAEGSHSTFSRFFPRRQKSFNSHHKTPTSASSGDRQSFALANTHRDFEREAAILFQHSDAVDGGELSGRDGADKKGHSGNILRRTASFDLRRSRRAKTSPQIEVKEEYAISPIKTSEDAACELKQAEDPTGLKSCYQKFKSLDLGEEEEVPKAVILDAVGDDNFEKFSFNTDLDSIFTAKNVDKDEDSIDLFDNEPCGESSLKSNVMTAFDEFDSNTVTESPSRAIKRSKLKLLVSKLKIYRSSGEAGFSTLEEASDEEYSPVEIKVPLFRSGNATISSLFSEATDLKSNGSPLFEDLGDPSIEIPADIKFDHQASILVYNGNSSCKSKCKEHSESGLDFKDLWAKQESEVVSLSDSTSTSISIFGQSVEHNGTEKDEKVTTVHSILKTKVNKNAADELYRARCCDNVNVDDFIQIFEANEMARLQLEPKLGTIRQKQIAFYYSTIEDGYASIGHFEYEDENRSINGVLCE